MDPFSGSGAVSRAAMGFGIGTFVDDERTWKMIEDIRLSMSNAISSFAMRGPVISADHPVDINANRTTPSWLVRLMK